MQQLFVVGGILIYAMLESLRVPTLVLGCIGGAFLCGNLMTSGMTAFQFAYAKRRFPVNWLIYSGMLLIFAVVSVTITIYIIGRLFLPPEVLHWKAFAPFWEFSLMASLVGGLLSYAYVQTKSRLESRNVEIQEALKSGA
ncbi:MAG: hypothetical protein ACXWCQ_35210 [Burkholderiales bacterium]